MRRPDVTTQIATRHRPTRGFTLLEVLIALTVLALALAAVCESFGGSSRRAQSAIARQSALEVAQSILAEQRTQPAPWAGHRTGISALGLRWTVDLSPAATMATADSRWRPVEVRVRVEPSGHARRAVEIRSIEWPPLEPST